MDFCGGRQLDLRLFTDLVGAVHLLYNKKGNLQMNIFKYAILFLETILYEHNSAQEDKKLHSQNV